MHVPLQWLLQPLQCLLSVLVSRQLSPHILGRSDGQRIDSTLGMRVGNAVTAVEGSAVFEVTKRVGVRVWPKWAVTVCTLVTTTCLGSVEWFLVGRMLPTDDLGGLKTGGGIEKAVLILIAGTALVIASSMELVVGVLLSFGRGDSFSASGEDSAAFA